MPTLVSKPITTCTALFRSSVLMAQCIRKPGPGLKTSTCHLRRMSWMTCCRSCLNWMNQLMTSLTAVVTSDRQIDLNLSTTSSFLTSRRCHRFLCIWVWIQTHKLLLGLNSESPDRWRKCWELSKHLRAAHLHLESLGCTVTDADTAGG